MREYPGLISSICSPDINQVLSDIKQKVVKREADKKIKKQKLKQIDLLMNKGA